MAMGRESEQISETQMLQNSRDSIYIQYKGNTETVSSEYHLKNSVIRNYLHFIHKKHFFVNLQDIQNSDTFQKVFYFCALHLLKQKKIEKETMSISNLEYFYKANPISTDCQPTLETKALLSYGPLLINLPFLFSAYDDRIILLGFLVAIPACQSFVMFLFVCFLFR